MPKFIIETTAESPIREFWQVEAANADAAREAFEDGNVGEFLWDEVTGEETDREVSEVHAFADMAGTIKLDRAMKEAPAMVEALREVTAALGEISDYPLATGLSPDVQNNALDKAFAILARIDGENVA